MRHQALEEELQRTKPPTNPDLDRARAILEDFARFWDAEPEPAERRKLILSLFEQVWQKDGQIVAVKPNHAFAAYFTTASEARASRPKEPANSEATKAGATGVEPRLYTASEYGVSRGFGSGTSSALHEMCSPASSTPTPDKDRNPMHPKRQRVDQRLAHHKLPPTAANASRLNIPRRGPGKYK